jgi:hypothetical protein
MHKKELLTADIPCIPALQAKLMTSSCSQVHNPIGEERFYKRGCGCVRLLEAAADRPGFSP